MPAITTPFRTDSSIDEKAFAANVDRQFDNGATGIVAVGCTGEFWALTMEERIALCATTVKAVAGRGPAIIGGGAIVAHDVVALSTAAAAVGADAILVMPPYFAHLTRAEIVAHFKDVNAGSALPIVLYNIPGNAGNAITPEIADELADLDKVVAIKESSGDWTNFSKTLAAVKDRIRVFCGPSSVFGVPAVLAGADGLIDCFPNVWAPGGLDLWHATVAGRMDEAWALQAKGQALTDLFVGGGRTLYPATKAAMDHLGLPGGGAPRAPLRSLNGPALTELLEGLDRILAA
ncbi:MAG: dihydrodipicolinate synthase family protein [Inquilinaceae bacterium]